jgi:putative ABC transport system substrate-binding protein
MDRRAFITGLGGGALLAPRSGRAQTPRTKHRIGWLSSALEDMSGLDALRTGLREVGYVEGRNVAIEARWGDGESHRLPQLAMELVRLPVDLLCTAGSPASAAARQATSTIPIVFANVAFPQESGLVASYARPGGNLTGVAFMGPEYGKRLELLKEADPRLARVALIYNPENRGSALALQETERWAAPLRVELEPHGFRAPGDLARVFGAITARRPDALMTTADPLIASHRTHVVELAAKHRLLAMYPTRQFVDAGGLMFYGGSIPEMYRRAATYVDRILKGARPGDLHVEQPTKFDMVVNLKVATALGLTLPKSLLLRADEVIQ